MYRIMLAQELFQDAPFEQWGEMGGSDFVYLLPLVAIIWLLVPKGGGGESKAKASSGRGGSLVTYAIVAIVAYVVISNGMLGGLLG